MNITRFHLRRIINEALAVPSLEEWAAQHNLPIDIDPLTGEDVILIDDEFAMRQGIPDGAPWNIERSYDDDGWVVTLPSTGTPDFEEISSGDLGDMDDIGIQIRGY
jgi:hypothetical protein